MHICLPGLVIARVHTMTLSAFKTPIAIAILVLPVLHFVKNPLLN
jgi:hypothetical protein